MRGLLIVIVLGLLVGCGGYVDPEFKPYLSDFRQAAKAQGLAEPLGVSIMYGDINGLAGVCEQSIFQSHIFINRGNWNMILDSGRRILIFHELGHCILGRSHDNGLLPDGSPKSLMNSQSVLRNVAQYDADPEYYLHELFHP